MISFIEKTFNIALTQLELVLLYISFCFVALAILFILFLLASRIIKNKIARQTQSFSNYFQEIINELILIDNVKDENYLLKINELKSVIPTSKLAKQILVDRLRELRKNLTGSSATLLENVFTDCELHQQSLNKILKGSWHVKAQGIRELADMNCDLYIDKIKNFVHSFNQTLREESFIALVRLEKTPTLSFLHNYKGVITDWMKINIHYHLSLRDQRTLPDFSKWYTHPNKSVRLFSLHMTHSFRLFSSMEKLMQLLKENEDVAALAAEALGEMEAYQAADEIARVVPEFQNIENALKGIKALGKVGNNSSHLQVLSNFLSHPSSEVVFETAIALKRTGIEGEKILKGTSIRDKEVNLMAIRKHIEEPLLQA